MKEHETLNITEIEFSLFGSLHYLFTDKIETMYSFRCVHVLLANRTVTENESENKRKYRSEVNSINQSTN